MNVISATTGAMHGQTSAIRKKPCKFVCVPWCDQILKNSIPLGTLEFPLQARVRTHEAVTGRNEN